MPDADAVPGTIPTTPLDRNDTANSLRIAYNDTDYTSTVTNSRGAVVVYDYNIMGQLEEIRKYNRPRDAEGNIVPGDAEKITTTIGYDKYGNITSIEDPNHHTTTYEYDAMGKMTKITYPEAEDGTIPEKTITFKYPEGILETIDENGNMTSELYDIQERLWKKTYYGDYNTYLFDEQIYYDGAGNDVFSIDGEGNRTETIYDSRNLPVKVYLAEDTFYNPATKSDVTLTPYVRYEYDMTGVKTGEYLLDFDNEEIETIIESDELGRITSTTRTYTDYTADPVEKKLVIEQIRYDANGNKTEYIDAGTTPGVTTMTQGTSLHRKQTPWKTPPPTTTTAKEIKPG
jgi:YD repeat-containing protein